MSTSFFAIRISTSKEHTPDCPSDQNVRWTPVTSPNDRARRAERTQVENLSIVNVPLTAASGHHALNNVGDLVTEPVRTTQSPVLPPSHCVVRVTDLFPRLSGIQLQHVPVHERHAEKCSKPRRCQWHPRVLHLSEPAGKFLHLLLHHHIFVQRCQGGSRHDVIEVITIHSKLMSPRKLQASEQ